MKPDIFTQKGVTLIELMVAMAVAGIVAAAMFGFQQSQTRSYVTQEALVNMQQNARAALHFMTSEIRMTGCDPRETAGAGIEAASANSIRVTMDFTGGTGSDHAHIEANFGMPSGGIDEPGEDITYELIGADLIREENHAGGDSSAIARHIDALDFVYYDNQGNRIDAANLATQRGDIRSVLITIVVRSGESVPGFMYRHEDNRIYENREGDVLFTANDNFRRIMLSEEVRLRNM